MGDIAVVEPEGPSSARLHRVIEVYDGGDEVIVATQGDANEVPDSDLTTRAPEVQVRLRSVPLVGYVVSGAGSRTGLLTLATTVALLTGWWALRALWRPAADTAGDAPTTA